MFDLDQPDWPGRFDAPATPPRCAGSQTSPPRATFVAFRDAELAAKVR